jgi:hypothetical protein
MSRKRQRQPKQLPGAVYNPVTFDPDRDIPTFVNEADVKWWAVYVGPRGSIYLTRRPPKRDIYVAIINNKIAFKDPDMQPVFEYMHMVEKA